MVNILRLTVGYLNATINMKPETQNRRLEPTGLAKPGETRGLTGTGPGLARHESAGRVFGRLWNPTDPFSRSKPGPLAGYPDPLLTLVVANCDHTSECVHWVPQQNANWSGGNTQGSISTRHFFYHIRICYSHKIRYLIIWHALFKCLYINIYGQSGHRW